MKDAMAVLKFNTSWLNRFSEFEGAIQLLDDTQSAINKGLINLDNVLPDQKNYVRLDPERYYKIKKIWEGGCFITRQRDPYYPTQFLPGTERFIYDLEKINFRDPQLEIIPLPSMDDMTPIGRIRDETLLIEISANVKLYLAYEGMDFETLIREGGLYHMENGSLKAKFSPSDMDSKVLETYKVGRSYYHKTMNILKRKFFEHWTLLKIDLHRIIVFQELQEQFYDISVMEGYQGQGQVQEAELDEVPYDFTKDVIEVQP